MKTDTLDFHRYGAVEWSEWDNFGMFDEVNKLIAKYHETDEDDFDKRVKTLLKESLNMLLALESARELILSADC